MGNFARKIIDAVQNLMLDKLLLRSIPFWWIASLWEERQPDAEPWLMASILFTLFVLFVLAWAVGTVANRGPLPYRGALAKVGRPPSNGFEAWSEPPVGGLRPPAFLRWIVLKLGRRNDPANWSLLIGFAVFAAALILLTALAHGSETFWAGFHPAFSDPSVRNALWIGATAVPVLMVLRQWASEQCDRLESPGRKARPPSGWVRLCGFSMFIALMTVLGYLIFQWPIWSVAVPIVPLIIVTVVPPWRRAFMDAWFGDAAEPDEPSAP